MKLKVKFILMQIMEKPCFYAFSMRFLSSYICKEWVCRKFWFVFLLLLLLTLGKDAKYNIVQPKCIRFSYPCVMFLHVGWNCLKYLRIYASILYLYFQKLSISANLLNLFSKFVSYLEFAVWIMTITYLWSNMSFHFQILFLFPLQYLSFFTD